MSYNLVDPTTGDLTQVAGGGNSPSVGTLLIQYKKRPISGYLYCDGSTFDENAYPALYMYLGSNVLPDYRECVMVGAEQNTTDTIAAHDVYGEGEFKDDQMQDHKHKVRVAYSHTAPADAGAPVGLYGENQTSLADGSTGAVGTAYRFGDTTHGKQKAVYVYIKATSGLAENQQDNVLKDVKDYVDSVVAGSMDKVESKYIEENVLTPTDWNTLNTKARYYFAGGTPMTNSPEEVPFGLLEVINVGPYCRIQRYFAFDGKLYMRRWSGSDWNEWYRFDGIRI